VTFSWQKALAAKASHGIWCCPTRAVERLETYSLPGPLPNIFRMTKGALNDRIFEARPSPPSMRCVRMISTALRGQFYRGLRR